MGGKHQLPDHTLGHCAECHVAMLIGKLTFPQVTENDSMKRLSPGDESRVKSKVTLGSVQPSK